MVASMKAHLFLGNAVAPNLLGDLDSSQETQMGNHFRGWPQIVCLRSA